MELFGAPRVCLSCHVGLKCTLPHGFIPSMSPTAYSFACSDLELLWLKSGVNKQALWGRNLKLRRGWPLFRLCPTGLEELSAVWTQTSLEAVPAARAALWGAPLPGGTRWTQTHWSCPFPGALTAPFHRGKVGLLAENNLIENGAQEPFTVSPNPLPSSGQHVLSPSARGEAEAAFKAGGD